MPDGKGTADEERDRKKRFIPKHARGAFLVELLLRGLSKNAAYPTYRLIRNPIRVPSFFTNIESNGLPPSARRTEFTL
jgi:hypothetical protein